MKVTTSSALPLILLVVACSTASPMFGTGGMMKRKFPGATDMTYRTYREIANSNARGGTPNTAPGAAPAAPPAAAAPGVVARTGGSSASDSGWMFGNDLAAPSSLGSSQPGSFTQQRTSFNQQGLPFYPQDPQDRYPSVWDPRDSYAFLQFPYHAPAPLHYEGAFVPQNKVYRHYY